MNGSIAVRHRRIAGATVIAGASIIIGIYTRRDKEEGKKAQCAKENGGFHNFIDGVERQKFIFLFNFLKSWPMDQSRDAVALLSV